MDDRVRGGNSLSVLFLDGEPSHATFSGHLDPTVLDPDRPAGFASQRTVPAYRAPDLSGYDALVLDVPRSDGKTYTLVLKDATPERRPDGRNAATIAWEHEFHCPGLHGGGRVVLHLRDFKPTYRGKPVGDDPPPPPLDRSAITQVGIMVRSFYGLQSGGFTLCVLSIVAYKYRSDAAKGDSAADEGGKTAATKGAAAADGRRASFFGGLGGRWLKNLGAR